MKRILASILSGIMLILIGLPALGSVGLGTRAMGMGGAFTAVADDESAFYWNPAGITQVKYASVMLGAGAQGENLEFITDTIDSISNTEELEPGDFETGKGYLNLGLIGGITTKYVGLNFYSETSAVATGTSGTNVEVSLDNFTYGALTIAGNFGEYFSVGLNVKKVIAGKGSGVGDSSVAINNYTEYMDGDGLAFDLGVLYCLSDQVSFGFVARNLGGEVDLEGEHVDYSSGSAVTTEYPKETVDLPKDFAVGVSYRPFKNTLLAFDIQKCDARLPYTPAQTRFRIGFEQTALWDIVAFRLGAYTNKDESTAFTAGLGFDFGPLAIGAAYVMEEIDGEEANEAVVTAGIRF